MQRVGEKEARSKAELFVVKNLARYVKTLHERAMGVLALKPDKTLTLVAINTETGEQEVIGEGLTVYRTPPDTQVLQYLIDRGLGRTPQRHEIAGDRDSPLQIIAWAPAGLTADQVIEGEAKLIDAQV